MNQEPSIDVMIARLAAADPIDERGLADRLAPFADDVIAEITDGSTQAPAITESNPVAAAPVAVEPLRRRRAWPLMAAAAFAAVFGLTAALALLPGTADKAYAITLDDGVVVVNWVRDLRDGSEIGRDLRAYGVDATVRAVPASPSRVGRVLTVAVNGVGTGDMPAGVSWGADGTDEVFTWRIDPSRFKESIQIEIGVEPDAGEPYVAAESAFAPGEVLGGLQCAFDARGETITAAAVDKQVRRLDIDARWVRVTEAPGRSGDLAKNVPSRRPLSGTVINVQPIDSRTVLVSVAPPGASLTAPIFAPVRPVGGVHARPGQPLDRRHLAGQQQGASRRASHTTASNLRARRRRRRARPSPALDTERKPNSSTRRPHMPLHWNYQSTRFRRCSLVAVVLTAVLATACGSPDEVAKSTYDGLDPALVAEATTHAGFVSRLEEQPDDTKPGLAQGMVINFVVCRQLLQAYEQLVTTGTAGPLPALPRPTNPESFSYDWWVKDHATMSTAVRNRDVDAIRQWITGEGSCGEWIPATANAPETISDRVAALGVAQ